PVATPPLRLEYSRALSNRMPMPQAQVLQDKARRCRAASLIVVKTSIQRSATYVNVAKINMGRAYGVGQTGHDCLQHPTRSAARPGYLDNKSKHHRGTAAGCAK